MGFAAPQGSGGEVGYYGGILARKVASLPRNLVGVKGVQKKKNMKKIVAEVEGTDRVV